MSFELFVYGKELSLSKREEVEDFLPSLLRQTGLEAKWHPGFDMTAPFRHASIPFKVRVLDVEHIPHANYYGGDDLLAYLDMTQRPMKKLELLKSAPWRHKGTILETNTEYMFSSAAGRDPLAFRLQVMFAATIAVGFKTMMLDPQSKQAWFRPSEAIAHAVLQATAFDESEVDDGNVNWNIPRFVEWPPLEVTT